jgi:hypothetical protein
MRYLIVLFIAALVILAVGLLIDTDEPNGNKSSITEQKVVTISQYQLKQTYGWKDIIMWAESKEAFESAYNVHLKYIDHSMGFKKDSTCSDPAGGDWEWKDMKVCFNYIWPPNTPDILSEIAAQSKGKTLVLIGSIYNNNENFLAQVYWY